MSERPEIFRGHFEECLRQFAAKLASHVPRGSRDAAQAKAMIAEFCGVTVGSITRWLHCNGSLPEGEQYFKLMCYLDLVGYRVIELERLPKCRRYFLELIGYSFMTIQEATEYLGYASTSSLYQVLQGHAGSSGDKDQKMWDAWKERKVALDELKRRLLGVPVESQKEWQKGYPRPEVIRGQPFRSKVVIGMMEGLLELLQHHSFDQLSENDRIALRQSVNIVLDLSARLSTLSSHLIVSEKLRKGDDHG